MHLQSHVTSVTHTHTQTLQTNFITWTTKWSIKCLHTIESCFAHLQYYSPVALKAEAVPISAKLEYSQDVWFRLLESCRASSGSTNLSIDIASKRLNSHQRDALMIDLLHGDDALLPPVAVPRLEFQQYRQNDALRHLSSPSLLIENTACIEPV